MREVADLHRGQLGDVLPPDLRGRAGLLNRVPWQAGQVGECDLAFQKARTCGCSASTSLASMASGAWGSALVGEVDALTLTLRPS